MKMKISLIFLLFISTYIFSGVYASQCKSYWECCECTSDYYKDCYECVNSVCDWNKIVSVHNRNSKCQGMVSSTTTTTVTISANRQTTQPRVKEHNAAAIGNVVTVLAPNLIKDVTNVIMVDARMKL